MHPVQSCPDVKAALARLPGSAWGLTCSPGALTWTRRVIEDDLDGRAVVVDERDRPIWHAAAVSASNGLAALLYLGESLLAAVGIERPADVLRPLAAGTLENVTEMGATRALTGPAVRGDADVVSRHLAALKEHPDHRESYSAVVRMILLSARRSRRIDNETANTVLRAVEAAP